VSGVVTAASSADTWVIDSCAPGAGCAPSFTSFTIDGDGPKLTIPAGTLVDASFVMRNVGGISTDMLLITNLPTWKGISNPVRADAGLWLDVSGHSDSPFTLAEAAQCALDGKGRDALTVSFSLKSDPAVKTAPVANAARAKLTVPSGPLQGTYEVCNALSTSGYEEIPGIVTTWIRWAP
jgi:hypothetical protein